MKKKLLSALLALCIFTSSFGVAANAVENRLSVSAVVDGVEISAVEAEGETYLFLPPNADIAELSLRFELNGEPAAVTLSGENGSAESAETVNLRKVAGKDRQGRYVFSAETEGVRERIYIMQGEGLPSMYLWSDSAEENRKWVDSSKENEAEGSMLLLSEDGASIYEGELTQIKARGNSTFKHYPKKAYQIKLDKKTDLLGTGEKVKTWVLLANYGDATFIHDKFFKDLSVELGMDYAITCDWVNLYYDGEYRGVYLLSEKISVGGDAVDITDMEELYEEMNPGYGDDMETAEGTNAYGQKYLYTTGLTEPKDLTGGWLIEKNMDFVDEPNGFFTAQDAGFNLRSPEFAGLEAMEYISEYYQEFENAVFATDEDGNYTGYNAETGKYYYEYCDLESLIQVFLIQELGLNPDGFYSSMYFRKEAGDIMYAGPIWDWDMSLGTGWTKYIPETVEDYHYIAKPLYKNPHFRAAVEEYYTTTFAPAVKAQLAKGGKIDEHIATLAPNAAMNFHLWPYVRVGHPENENHLWPSGTTYKTVTEDMKSWLTARIKILDRRFYNEIYTRFSDVAPTDWEYKAVVYAVNEGILNGVSESRFDPDGGATRGMICTVLARMAGEDTTPAEGENWMQPGLDWAMANGISDGSKPTAAITREQLATMLWRYEGEPESEGSLDNYTDGASVSPWAAEAMEWASAEGIFKGDDKGALNPTGGATRAQIAQVIYNYLSK